MNPEHLYESITGLDDRFILETELACLAQPLFLRRKLRPIR